MRDILVLQEQVNILDAMVQRQAEISRIADNYEDVGINFRQPLPPEDTCRKIPVNLLCLVAYPDMEEYTPFFDEQKERLVQKQQEAMEEAIASLMESMEENRSSPTSNMQESLSNIEDDLGVDLSPELTVKDIYFWSDIQCALGQCSALIVSSLDENERHRVRKGDSIDEDITIRDINLGGVQVNANDENIFLRPLPLGGFETAVSGVERRQTRELSGLLDRELQSVPDNNNSPDILRGLEQSPNGASQNVQETSVSSPPPEFFGEDSAPEEAPTLGPTGLF
jgi:hypothetical protein